MTRNTESTPLLESAENIAALIAQLGEDYRTVLAGCEEIRTEAYRRGGVDGSFDMAGHIGPDQIQFLLASALNAAGLGAVLKVPESSVGIVHDFAAQIRAKVARANSLLAQPARRKRHDDPYSLDWLPNHIRQTVRHDMGARKQSPPERVNGIRTDVDDEQHIATVQSGVPGRAMRPPQDAA